MAASLSSQVRVTVDGKFFRLGERKFFLKGVSYGPFAPDSPAPHFASPARTTLDFAQIRGLQANVLRVYHVPPRWFLDLAAEFELRVLVDIPWSKHLCFLDSSRLREQARSAIRETVEACAGHPSVLAFSVANEIPPDIVRWSGARAVADFIDDLVADARRADHGCLCTFTSFPPTEFLRPQSLDFLCFNVYLHHRQAFKNYLARLQMIADTKPLVLAEFGLDSEREGESEKSAILSWQIEEAFRTGLAGAVVFSYTDDWWRARLRVEDWHMGLTTRDRQPKDSFAAVREQFHIAPSFPLEKYPRVSVVVASYEGGSTLGACLDSLERLNYPDYEVILVDDGSTDDTPRIALSHPKIRYLRHPRNLGLGVARNTGIAAATGEIVGFTDADCRADEDWLYYLVGDLLEGDFVGVGGHNLLPPDASPVSAAVMVSPGGPAHVMLTDSEAEHVPGCNMAFYKWALEDVGGFDPIFRRAGDDVDICWRLQRLGHKIGFSRAGFVWHYRRSTFAAYLRQQKGYGEAEALLVQKHPEYFSALGGSIWRGRIYASSKFGIVMRAPIVYHGVFGSAMFQTLYTAMPVGLASFFSSLEYHVLVTLPLVVVSVAVPRLMPLVIASLALSVGVCVAAAVQAEVPPGKRRWWSRPAVALLFFLQPISRGWARYRGQLVSPSKSSEPAQSLDSLALSGGPGSLEHVNYWAEHGVDRIAFVGGVVEALNRQGWPNKPDAGWSDYDVRVFGNRWTHLQLTTVTEDYPKGAQMLRCRLRTAWTLRARVALWLALAVELLVTSLIGRWWPCFAAAVLTVALFAWFIAHQQRKLRSLMVLLLDQVAKRWNLTKVTAADSGGESNSLPP
jgi:glycosyltransferase involved in cell wall biosynthesis